jgi:hypothetical protein
VTTVYQPVYASCQCGALYVRDGFVTYHRDTDSYTVEPMEVLHGCETCGKEQTWTTMEVRGQDESQ